MLSIYKRANSILCFFVMASFSLAASAEVRNTFVFLAGDSTMAKKQMKDFPETGWGVPFSQFFNDTVSVRNLARNGRSTRTFISEGRWQKLIGSLKKDDIVFIQFGHNDEHKKKTDRYTSPSEYQANLKKMIGDVRALEAEAILMTPVIRRVFDKQGKLVNTHPYASLARSVANDTKVRFIDMERVTHEYFEEMGAERSTLRFMHIEPGLHPNYPFGVRDNTHYNELGAREVAQLVLQELKNMEHPLASRLREVDPKHMSLSY